MTTPHRLFFSYFLAALIALGIAPSLARAQSTLYSVAGISGDSFLRTVDPANGATISTVTITLPGFTVNRLTGLATHPTTGELYALLVVDGDPICPLALNSPQRRLVRLNPTTGVATSIGNTGDCFAGLAFHTNGTLYGVTGDGASTPASLFIINTTTAAPTFLLAFGTGPCSGCDGEALAFNPTDGLLYHASGRGTKVFQSVNPANLAVADIPLSGFDSGEFTALTHSTGNTLLGGDLSDNLFSITTGGVRTFIGTLATTAKGLAFVTAQSGPLAAAVLPSSRAVQVGTAATAFATIINAGTTPATNCGIALLSSIPANFSYQTTNPATNQVTGTPNTPAGIGAGLFQTYVFSLTPTAPIASTDVQFAFDCTNTNPATNISGVNTLLFLGSAGPTSDIVALAGTLNNDGIVNIPGTTGIGFFVVATVNLGISDTITATADTGGAVLPVDLSICQTDPGTGVCLAPPSSSVTLVIAANATPTFAIFAQGTGNVAFNPATNRIFVRFKNVGAITHGSTSVAVRTATP